MTTNQTSTTYLLAISIGPVQEFIAASRKARDLWYGSYLLSRLSRIAAQSLNDAELNGTKQVRLIFPAEQMLAQPDASFANKLLVEVLSGNPAELARTARAAVQRELLTCWEEALRQSNTPVVRRVVDLGLLQGQLADFVEWYAAWMPYDPNDPASYAARRKDVELLLAGRKALRDFAPARGVDGLPKSSLDPSRETVLLKAAFNDLSEEERRALRLKLSEQLDGVSMIKRLGGKNRIASVSRVAIDPFLRLAEGYGSIEDLAKPAETLKTTELVEAFSATDANNHLERYSAFPYDCQLFYEPNADAVCEQYKDQLDAQQRDAVKAFIGNVRDITDVAGLGDLSAYASYMAILVADGDRMGKALGALTTPEDHITFSNELVAFANRAVETVKNHFGVTIYTGGDDVLAFLPLDTALTCAYALKEAFADTMKEALPDTFEQSEVPTLSAGIAIGHYSDHLQVLLERGRDAEKRAKVERNSLAVSFTPRSGGTHTVSHRWDTEPIKTCWWPAIDALHHDAIPDGVVYEIGQLCAELAAADDHEPNRFPAGFIANEVNRVFDRKRTRGGSDLVHARVRKMVNDRLGKAGNNKTQIAELRSLADELYIARRIMPVVRITREDELKRWKAADAEVDWLAAPEKVSAS